MPKTKFNKFLAMVLITSLIVGLIPEMPNSIKTVQAEDIENTSSTPSITSYATKGEIMTKFDLDGSTDEEGNIDDIVGKIVFGKNSAGDPQEWYILGTDKGVTGDNVVLFASSPLVTGQVFEESKTDKIYQPEWGCNYKDGTEPTTVFANYYGASKLRTKLLCMQRDTNYFSKSEQKLMNENTITTEDTKNSVMDSQKNFTKLTTYTITDKLYCLKGAHNEEIIYAGSCDDIEIVEKYWKDTFWIRSPYPTTAKGDGVFRTSFNSERGTYCVGADSIYYEFFNPIYIVKSNIQPACNLNLSTVSFASAVPTSSVEIFRLAPEGTAMTLRLDGSSKDIGQASYGDKNITAQKDENATGTVYLVVQGNDGTHDWYYKSEVSTTTTVTLKEIQAALRLTDVSFADCKVWLETTLEDGMTYAKEAHRHTTTPVEAQPATCTNAGNKAYYACACGKWFEDAEAAHEITDHQDVVLSALGHNWDKKVTDAAHLKTKATDCRSYDSYWYSCSRCDAISDESDSHFYESNTRGPHSYKTEWNQGDEIGHWHDCKYCNAHDTPKNHTPGEAPTETTPQTCTECGHVIKPALEHTHRVTYVAEKPATCTEEGTQAHYTCVCGKCFEDAAATKEIIDHNDIAISPSGHNWSIKIEDERHLKEAGADCRLFNTYWYECSICGEISHSECFTSETTGSHCYETEWNQGDESGHWNDCKYCNAHNTPKSHTPGEEPTETTPQTCTECGYVIKPALEHTHHTTAVAAKPATCTEDGNQAYYSCVCGKWFEDAAATKEITDRNSVTIKATGHILSDWKYNEENHWKECIIDGCNAIIDGSKEAHKYNWFITKKATTDTEGEITGICSDCGYVIKKVIPPMKNSSSEIENSNGSGQVIVKPSEPNDNEIKAEIEEDLIGKVPLTDKESEDFVNGDNVTFILQIKDITDTVSEADRQKTEENLGENTAGMYLDISLWKQIGSNPGEYICKISEKIGITIKVPETLKNTDSHLSRTYQIMKLYNNTVKIVDTVYNAEAETLSFATDKFSTYALLYSDSVKVSPTKTPGTTSIPGISNTPITSSTPAVTSTPATTRVPETTKVPKTKLHLKAVAKNNAIKLTWKKQKNADGYIIYGSRCGRTKKKLKTITSGKKTTWTQKKLKKGKYYKYSLAAYRNVGGKKRIIVNSICVHATTNGNKYGNPTKVTVKKRTLTLKKGKKVTIKAKYKSQKPVKEHIAAIRYKSTNKKIATVTKKGNVKAVGKGRCTIFVYAQNGCYTTVKVRVK